ncbi:hypothetical protein JL720_7644 [Aureococcus anophagefferens]|nr:hypothetical protein JL720_7644 [Aureococcus anophagefferens]
MPSFRLTKDMPTATVLDGSQFVAAAPIATVLDVQRVESPLLADLVASEITSFGGARSIVTEHGVVGDGEATGQETQAIAWDGFDVDKVHITRYDDARER